MAGRRPGVRRLLRLRASRADDVSDVDAEIRVHLAMRVEQLVADGWGEAEAEAEAGRLFGVGSDAMRALRAAARERNRRMRTRERWESWWQDVRHAGRGLARDPLLAVFVVVMLALGIGMNVTAFSLVDRLLLRDPEHVREPDRLTRLYGTVVRASIGEETSAWIPWPVYTSLRGKLSGFEQIAAYRVQERVVGRGESARTVRVGQAMDDFFVMLGVRPMRGRLFGAGDVVSAGPVAVVGARYWETVLGSDPGAIGATIRVGDAEHTIVGIAPAGFSGIEHRRIDVWIAGDVETAGTMNWKIVGRLRPGLSPEAVTMEAMAIFRRTRAVAPQWYREAELVAGSIRHDDDGGEPFEATMAKWLSVVSGVILLVALTNVVSLLLVRLARRRRELAVRVALGSGRARVVRLLALEGVLLALAGGVASLFVARVAEPLIRRVLFADEVSWTLTLLDVRLLIVAALFVVATSLVTALTPLLQSRGTQLWQSLRSGPQSGSSNPRVRGVLMVAQASLSVMLLVGAGLFLRSLARIDALDLGVDRDRVIAAEAHLPPLLEFTTAAFERARAHEIDVYRRLELAVLRVAGVERASVAVGLPLDGGSFAAPVFVDGLDSIPVLPGGGPYASVVGPGYFATIGTRVLRGRPFDETDREATERVIIIAETMAERLWPGRDPLGDCIRIGAEQSCYRIVGIVEDVHRVGLREQPSLQYYIPIGQQTMFSGARLLVRQADRVTVSWADLQRAMLAVDPTIRAVELRWLRQALDGEMRPLRLGMVTFGLSAGLALVVVIVGLYGLLSYMVAWRTREIGVRLAIGATDARISRMVIGGGAGLAALGVVIGLLVSGWAGRWVQPHLFETSAVDPLVFAAVAAVLMIVAVVAGWLPARRALAISPTEALRAE
ncbi:MAG: ADOP family duplicated permease [Gemmatimonadetes bacterium]|nr:ADOP family duplicated permease [Gemmatimonadota bacterium]